MPPVQCTHRVASLKGVGFVSRQQHNDSVNIRDVGVAGAGFACRVISCVELSAFCGANKNTPLFGHWFARCFMAASLARACTQNQAVISRWQWHSKTRIGGHSISISKFESSPHHIFPNVGTLVS